MIPDFDGDLLPAGIHETTLDDVVDAFGDTVWRDWLIEGLRLAMADLAAARCGTVYLDGSFVTAKERPNDYDLVWEMENVDLDALHPILREVGWPRNGQKLRYRGDVLPNVIESNSGTPMLDFFQVDKETGARKGILKLDPRTVAP